MHPIKILNVSNKNVQRSYNKNSGANTTPQGPGQAL
jgi:hypothetical protein